MSAPVRVVGVCFDHMHIGDQLRTAIDHPDAEIVGVYDTDRSRMSTVCADLGLSVPQLTDWQELISQTKPDIAFVCSPTTEHADWVSRLSGVGVHCILEKPFATSLVEVEQMMRDVELADTLLTVNWPLAWVAAHRTTKRLIDEGAIGSVHAVHFYDGNRGPLRHSHGKVELSETAAGRQTSWWYSRTAGGGSMRDYLGYGTTLATWFRDGELPRAVSATWHIPAGLEVDEQSVVVAEYEQGLSVFETRWGTPTDPWTIQPEPRCGFVVSGSGGSLASWDYEQVVTVHPSDGAPRAVPVDAPKPEDSNALANVIAHLQTGRPLDPPLTAEISRAGHIVVEAAVRSAENGQRVTIGAN